MLKRNRKFIMGLLVLTLVVGMSPKTAHASNLDNYNNQIKRNDMRLDKLEEDKANTKTALDGLNEEIKNLIEEQEELSNKLDSTTRELNALNLQLDQLEDKISELNLEIEELESEMQKTKAKIKIKEEELELNQGYLNNRVRQAYKANPVNQLISTLISSESIFDFYERLMFINYMAEEDRKLIEEIDGMMVELHIVRETLYKQGKSLESKLEESEEMKEKVSELKDKVTIQKENLELEMKAVENLENRRRRAYSQLSKEEREIAQKIGDIQTENKELEAHIQKIIIEAQRKAEEERKKREAEAKAKAEAESQKVPDTSHVQSTGFLRPIPGRVTSSYGNRTHPILGEVIFHTGIDYAGATGTPIKATKSGTITASSYMGTYGNAVIIDHGNGESSLYAHLNEFNVKSGDRVSQGETIGTVGSTGRSTGPHLHFEIRINGKHVNPANYIN